MGCSYDKQVMLTVRLRIRVLKHFKNIKNFSDPSQNTKEKEKGEKESEDYFCIICSDKYIGPPMKT